MQLCLNEMFDLVKTGVGSPNTESTPKPLPWVPLMCAAAINDAKMVNMLCREGADPNQPNKNGTTPVMLAAQLNNSTALLELIQLGGKLDVLDNEGLDAQAYAGSLPTPSSMRRCPPRRVGHMYPLTIGLCAIRSDHPLFHEQEQESALCTH